MRGIRGDNVVDTLYTVVSRTTEAKTAEKREKNFEAVIALSTAIDLYDRNENEKAKKQLTVARKFDPDSEATAYFLTKLTANTTRFKVLMEQYYSYLNPAFLGIMDEDMFHLAANFPVYPIVTHNPIGRRWGMRVDVLPTVGSLNRGWQGDYESVQLNTSRTAAGAVLGIGFLAREALAFGAGLGLYSDLMALVNLTWNGVRLRRQ